MLDVRRSRTIDLAAWCGVWTHSCLGWGRVVQNYSSTQLMHTYFHDPIAQKRTHALRSTSRCTLVENESSVASVVREA